MSLRSIDIVNVLCFRRQRADRQDREVDGFHLDFCDGVNVLIGGNGMGKTSLLKLIYAATQMNGQGTEPEHMKSLLYYFSDRLKGLESLKSYGIGHDDSFVRVTSHDSQKVYSLKQGGTYFPSAKYDEKIPSVYIPVTEMLCHSKGFLAMNQKYGMPFDGTEIDIIVNASLPETRTVNDEKDEILQTISTVIQGTVIQEDDVFYILREDGRKVDFSLEAEGRRKLGLIWKLIRNGLLEPGSVLLWDLPETHLDPELYPMLADLLLKIQHQGVQIFLATNSYNLAKYLEIRRGCVEDVLFHNLYWKENQDGTVQLDSMDPIRVRTVGSTSGTCLEDLPFNTLMDADNALLNEVFGLREG
ncbi:MAG: ATP-binding protein [Clostridia bacterium]|nr:ATP-binding protein [Clostridia bacterium]